MTCVAPFIPRWFARPQTVTHLGTNRAVAQPTLIEAFALPLSQTAHNVLIMRKSERARNKMTRPKITLMTNNGDIYYIATSY